MSSFRDKAVERLHMLEHGSTWIEFATVATAAIVWALLAIAVAVEGLHRE